MRLSLTLNLLGGHALRASIGLPPNISSITRQFIANNYASQRVKFPLVEGTTTFQIFMDVLLAYFEERRGGTITGALA